MGLVISDPKNTGNDHNESNITDSNDTNRQDEHSFDPTDDKTIVVSPISRRRRRKQILYGVLLVAIACIVWIVYSILFGTNGSGQVRGYVLKIERNDGLFDSYEGTLVIDYPPTVADSSEILFNFSVRNQKVGLRLAGSMAHTDSLVVISYDIYNSRMPWRGKTKTLVKDLWITKPTPLSRDRKR